MSVDTVHGVGKVRSGPKELNNGSLPALASYLDEHCLIIRKDSGLRFDENLTGWHMYGADICLQAYDKGLRCYAIDNRVHHLSDNLGLDPKLDEAVKWFKDKWMNRSQFPKYRTTCRAGIILCS